MLSRFHQKIGSILGLLAVLMAALAPTVSHALAASRAGTNPVAALCSASAAHADASEGNADLHSLAAHWHACGYCGLFAHTPALPTVQTALAIAVMVVEQREAARFESVRRVFAYTAAQPRAPPLSS